MQMRDVLLNRFKWDDVPSLQPAKIALTRALNIYDDVREQHAKLADNPNLTSIGRQDAIRKYVAENAAAELHRVRHTVTTARSKLTERRTKLQPPPPDKTDLAGAVLRSEMRTMLRGMPNGARQALLLSTSSDPALLQAVLEAPNYASGVTDQIREIIINAVVEKTHPGQIAAIEQAEEAIDLVNAAARVAFDAVRAAGEFPDETTLSGFVKASLPSTTALDADIERSFDSLANAG